MSTILTAVITALLTTVATNLLIGPRLEARNRRIQEAHKTRDKFKDNIFDLLSYTLRLANAEVPAEATETVAEALRGERARWTARIEEVTAHLIDDGMQGPLTYPLWVRDLGGNFATSARMVWISERSEQSKIELLRDLAEHAQGIYGRAWWRRPWTMPDHVVALRRLIDDAAENRR